VIEQALTCSLNPCEVTEEGNEATIEDPIIMPRLMEPANVPAGHFSQREFLITYKNYKHFLLTPVSVQHWLNGNVIKEKFYYQIFEKWD